MQWSGSEINAGFSNADHTWLPVNPNYINVNVDSELADPFSHLNIYKRLIEARKSDLVFDFGEFKGITVNNILAFSRSVDLFFYQTVTFVNFNSEQVTYDFSETFGYRFQSGLIYVSTQGTGEGYVIFFYFRKKNQIIYIFFLIRDVIELKSVTLGGYEGILVYLLPI